MTPGHAVARKRSGRPPHELPAWIEPAPVRAWMRQPVVTARSDTLVRDAVALMKARRVRHLPILDTVGRLVGIVTDRDLRQIMFEPGIQARLGQGPDVLDELTVREVMTWGVITVKAESDIREAAHLMREQKLGALPVMAGGQVVGILTETDALRALETLLRTRVTRVKPLEIAGKRAEDHDTGIGGGDDDTP